MEIKAELFKPYTDEKRIKFIVENNHKKGYTIEESATSLVALGETEEEKTQAKKEQFNKDFFLTSLGYIRRKVTMKTGETKDFLSDLLPVISMGVNSGQAVTIIAYKEPDFAQDVTDWEALQEQKIVTAEFISECFARLSSDFTG